MSGILNVAVTGLNAAAARVANAAASIVNASSTTNSGKNAVNAGSDPSSDSLDQNIVELKVDQVNYGANALVIKTAEKMQKALLDIKT